MIRGGGNVHPGTTNILLFGGNFHNGGNMGDRLMLRAVIDRLRNEGHGDVRLVMHPTSGQYQHRAQEGLYQLLWPSDWRRLSGGIGRLFLQRYADSFGIVTEDELDCVIDFTGFRYGDIGKRETIRGASDLSRWRRKGARAVFLPQAFGPFGSNEIKAAMRRILENADVVYARDVESERHLRNLNSCPSKVKRCPDLTIPLQADEESRARRPRGGLCIIPNLWMVERTAPDVSNSYVRALGVVARVAQANGVRPFIVMHSARQDEVLARLIQDEFGTELEVVRDEDPLVLKAIIGQSQMVVGSRYHGLVAALSQNVPTLGTSWSHKYAGLFDDFACPENLMRTTDEKTLTAKTEELLNHSEELHARLLEANQRLCGQVEEMWKFVSSSVFRR